MVVAARCLWRWVLLALVVQTRVTVSAEDSGSVVRLGVNRVQRNSEIDRLIANSVNAQTRVLPAVETDRVTAASSSLLRSLLAAAAPRTQRTDADVTPVAVALRAQTSPSLPEAVETRIRSGEGSHTITVFVGGQERELIIDTGSGKTAFVCDGCSGCGHRHKHKPFHPTNTTKFVSCDRFHPGDPELGGCMECVGAKCRYGQKYVEGDYWEAFKMSDHMSFSVPGKGSVDHLEASIEFGCIYAQTGCFNQQTSDGIMGFSRHPDAIYEQFYRKGATASRIFAQCLATDGGALTIGGVDMQLNRGSIAYTPLRDTGYQYWTVHLESISVGTVPLAVDSTVYNADRGCVLDSGTTFVYLPSATKSAFIAAWRQARGGSDDDAPLSDSYHRVDDSSLPFLPPICFHFANQATLCMGADMYLYKLASGEYAGTIFFGDQAKSTIVGASALMHHNIIYDVDNNRVGMAEANCDAEIVALSSEIAAEKMIALELHPGGDTFRVSTVLDPAHWSQIVLASVAMIAMAGLVVTVWEETRRSEEVILTATESAEPFERGTKREIHEDDQAEFAFYLMPDDE